MEHLVELTVHSHVHIVEHRKALQANVTEYFSLFVSLFVEHSFLFHHLDELANKCFMKVSFLRKGGGLLDLQHQDKKKATL